MANLFTPWTSGTFEVDPTAVETYYSYPGYPTGGTAHWIEQNNSFNHTIGGVYSGRITYYARQRTATSYVPGLFSTVLFQNAGGIRPIGLTVGKKYTLTAWVYVPSSNKVGSDAMQIVIAAKNWQGVPSTFWANASIVTKTVLQATNMWQVVSITFIYDGTSNYSFEVFGYDATSEAAGVSQVDPQLKAKIGSAIGTGNSGGLIFIDDIDLSEVPVCDLALGSPSYSKTNETVSGAHDGTITVNDVTTSYTPQFSIDNVNWFLSNHGVSGYLFSGLAPGTYNIYVRDNNPLSCATGISGIVITAGAAPGCDLAFGVPSFTKTNETILTNDGTITVNATSSHTPILYSLDNSTWQSSNVFTGLHPGTYHVYVKDNIACTLDITGIVIYAYGALTSATIDEIHANRYNFIWWRNFSGEKGFNSVLCNGCYVDDIPNPYTLDKQKVFRHYPIAVPNEGFSFYANLDSPVVDPNYSQWKLALANSRGIVIDNIAPLSFDLVGVSTFNFYCPNIVIPNGYLGIYFLVVYSNVDNTLKFISNEIQVMNLVDSTDKFLSAKFVSTRVQFKNTYNLYGYNYEGIPSFVNAIRLRIYKVDEEPAGTLTQYRAVSTGILRNVIVELDKLLTLEAYWFDDYAHQAMFVLQVHDTLEFNGRPYIVQTLYTVSRDVRYNANKGTLMVFDQNFSSANRFGQANTIPDSDEIDGLVLGGDDGAVIGADDVTMIGL